MSDRAAKWESKRSTLTPAHYLSVSEFCSLFGISRSHYYKRLEAIFIAEKIMLNVPPPDGPPRIALGRAERWLLKNQDPK